MRKTLLGLHEAHQAQLSDGRSLELVHRDVKPANILISFAGDVKITDFGIAKSALQNRMTTAGVVKGTVRYLSPEQIRSEKISFRSDLFSCASVLTEVLTDKPLYDRGPVAPTLMAILNDQRAPIRDLLPFRAPELAEVLERALRSRPEDRFGSALEMAQALGAAARALGPPVSDDAVGSLLRQLFQGSAETTASGGLPEDVTYLITHDSAAGRASEPVATPRGGTPLDAEVFRRGPSPLPEAYVEAERRAAAMLDEAVVIDDPVEVEGEEVSDDLDLDLDDLDVDDAPPVEEAEEARLEARGPAEPGADEARAPEAAEDAARAPLGRVRGGARAPQRSGEYGLVDAEKLRAQLAAEQASALASSAALPAADAEPLEARGERSSLRFYLLLGCLAGVLLTSAVLLATGL
jgi:hypothetical protein